MTNWRMSMNNKTVIQQFATTAQVSEYGKGLVATTLFALPSTAEPLSIGILPQDNEFLLTDFGIACEILERNQVDVQEVLPKILEIAQKYDLQWVDYELHAKCLEQDVSKCWGRMVEGVMLVCEIGV